MTRIIFGILLLISIIYGYWWLTWCFALLLLFYYPVYYEIIALGIIYDSLYSVPLPQFFNVEYVFTIFSLLIFAVSLFIKKRLIVYEF